MSDRGAIIDQHYRSTMLTAAA